MYSVAVDDILVAGYYADGKDYDETVGKVLQRSREVNLKLNKDKCHFTCTSVPFFGKIIFMAWSKTRPTKDQGPNGNATP